mmetsp:Transcript_21638/g.45683  ORF Transcript_21638/g.45683 Transcript_21638/m.45683 type:complete len:296 (+) Transcript_21638:561-1448(+)
MFFSSSMIRSCISCVLLSFISFPSVSSSSCSRSSSVISTVTFSFNRSSSFWLSAIRSSYSDWISFVCSSRSSNCFLSSSSVRHRSSTISPISFLRELTTSSQECSICVIWWDVASIRLHALASWDWSFITYCESAPPASPFGATLLMSSAYSLIASLFVMSFSSIVSRSSTAFVWRLRRSTSILWSIDSFIWLSRSLSSSFWRFSSSCCFSSRSLSRPEMVASFDRTSLSRIPRSPSSSSVSVSGSSCCFFVEEEEDRGVVVAATALTSPSSGMVMEATPAAIDSVVVSSAMVVW